MLKNCNVNFDSIETSRVLKTREVSFHVKQNSHQKGGCSYRMFRILHHYFNLISQKVFKLVSFTDQMSFSVQE